MEIKNNGNHEIGSLTFSHYYCHETGQTIEQFEDDLKSAVAIANTIDIKAAKKGELFNLWWHTHNFGANTNKIFNNLNVIFKEY